MVYWRLSAASRSVNREILVDVAGVCKVSWIPPGKPENKGCTMPFDTNAIFLCDAITLLERLPSDTVTLSYLDAPWNMQNLHSVSERMTLEAVKASNEQHAIYLSRIVQQLRRILNNNGSLFVHWSSASPLDVRLVMNQAFGEQPRYEIIWVKKGLKYKIAKTPVVDNEILLVYTKSDKFIYNPIVRQLLPDLETSTYFKKDDRGPYRLVDMTSPFDRNGMRFTWRDYKLPPRKSWRFRPEMLESLVNENRISFPASTGLPRLKQYLSDHPGTEIGTSWDDIAEPRRKGRIGYPNEKPQELLTRIVELASHSGDLVLDPFFGSGTTLVAAQSQGRKWWGSDNSSVAHEIAMTRLNNTYGLTAGKDYAIYSLAAITEYPIVHTTYKDVVTSVEQISQLQQDISTLNNHLLSLKKLMNISENDDEEKVEQAIEQMEHWISVAIASQAQTVENYIAVVCSWLASWDRLDLDTQTFLPQAELLYENILDSHGVDYSPFILQYCKALENELLTKVFTAYTKDLYARENVSVFLKNEFDDEKTCKFATFLKERRTTYTLGDMAFIMQLMKEGGQTIKSSHLLQDFRQFILQYFTEHIIERSFLKQITIINEDFRRKAAHPQVLGAEIAERCRLSLRTCLNEFILSYKGDKDSA